VVSLSWFGGYLSWGAPSARFLVLAERLGKTYNR